MAAGRGTAPGSVRQPAPSARWPGPPAAVRTGPPGAAGARTGWAPAVPPAGQQEVVVRPGRPAAAEPGRPAQARAAAAPGRPTPNHYPKSAQRSLPLRPTQRPKDPWSIATFVPLQVTVS